MYMSIHFCVLETSPRASFSLSLAPLFSRFCSTSCCPFLAYYPARLYPWLQRWTTVSWDKVNNFGHDDIIATILELGHRPNKAGNVVVDARLGTRTTRIEIVDHRLSPTTWHFALRPENVTEDNSKVYDVAHHEADILIAKEMVEADHILQERTHPFS